jgi:hypothetical protein
VLQLYSEMGQALALSTGACIQRKPLLLAKLLAALPPEQAAAQFAGRLSRQSHAQQAAAATAVLQAMQPQQAAALLLAQQGQAQQQRLLLAMVPAAAAALLEWVLPATALRLLVNAVAPAGNSATPALVSSAGEGSWAAEVLRLLPDRQLIAMLAVAQPEETAVLLPLMPFQEQHQLLQRLPPSVRAAALAVAHQREAAAARRQEAACAAAAAEAPAALAALDVASALLAHFQLLSAAEKTHLLQMGPAGSAALLLPQLPDVEVSDVVLLLPAQRQEQLLAALHPAHEGRLKQVMREASRRRSSLLLPQLQMAAAAAAATAAEASQPQSAAAMPGEPGQAAAQADTGLRQPARMRRASSLLQPARRPSMAAPGAAAIAASSAGNTAGRRGSLQPASRHGQQQQRRGSRSASLSAAPPGSTAAAASDAGELLEGTPLSQIEGQVRARQSTMQQCIPEVT